MHYLVDGYNLLFLVCQKQASLESRRDNLIDLLNQELSFLKGRCSLIFDSAEQIRECPECAFVENLEVIYTPKGLTADAYIIELAEQNRAPKTLTVVTSDSGLARQCKHIGTHVLSIEAFLTFIAKKNRKKEKPKPENRATKAEIERLRKIFEERLDN